MKGILLKGHLDQNKDRPAESFMLLLNIKKNTCRTTPIVTVPFYLSLIHRLQVKKSLQKKAAFNKTYIWVWGVTYFV